MLLYTLCLTGFAVNTTMNAADDSSNTEGGDLVYVTVGCAVATVIIVLTLIILIVPILWSLKKWNQKSTEMSISSPISYHGRYHFHYSLYTVMFKVYTISLSQ